MPIENTRGCSAASLRLPSPRLPFVLILALLIGAGISGSTVAQSSSGSPQMKNFQHLVCNYSESTGELSLALLSISNKTDPIKASNLQESLEVKLEVDGERSSFVEAQHLKVAILGQFRAEMDRRYTLFRFNLVIDESTSIQTPHLMEARRIIDSFFRRIPVVYEAQIIRFSSQVTPPSLFTNDLESLRLALGPGQDRLSGGTDFYNALGRAVRELSAYDDLPLQFTVAFTDGADTSGQDFETVKRSLQQATEHEQIFLFIAGIGTDGEIRHDLLGQLPGKMGLYYELPEVGDVDQVFDRVAQMLDKTYILRIPTVSSHAGAKKVYILRKKSVGGHETIQDIVLPPRCVPP